MAGEEFTEDQAKVVDQLLLQAVESADGSRIDLCLRKGADIDARNGQGRTPLMLAIWHENPNLTEFILARKPSLFLKDNGGKSAFDHIADVRRRRQAHHDHECHAPRAARSRPQARRHNCRGRDARRSGSEGRCRERQRCDRRRYYGLQAPLPPAAPEPEGFFAMTDLTREQKEALGKMMIEGCKKGDPEIIQGCFKRGADPDVSVQDGDSGARKPVLHWAAYHFNEKAMQTIIDGGANLETRDPGGDTALFVAIRNSRTAAVECLMRNGADPLAQNDSKQVAMDLARALREDYDQYATIRKQIIKALTKDYGLPREQSRKPAQPANDVVADIMPPPPPAKPGDAEDDIQVLKPLSLQARKTGPGFNL